MSYKFDHDYHIHSQLSLCGNHPLQTKENILQYAKDNGLHTICITDHFWDEAVPGAWADFYTIQNYEHISKILPLPQAEGIRFLFGCEAEMDKNCTIAVSKEKQDIFDFIIIPTTHFHMRGLTVAEEDLVDRDSKVKVWIKRIDAVINSDLPHHKVGLAHLTTGLIEPEKDNLLKFLDAIPGKELERLFTKCAELRIAIELNIDSMNYTDDYADIMLRPYEIARECGCKLYFGSDAHIPEELAIAKPTFEKAIRLLNLKEEDMLKL